MRILVLYRDTQPGGCSLAIQSHLRTLSARKGKHRVIYWNVFYGVPGSIASLRNMDAVILHTTLLCMRWSGDENFKRLKQALRWVKDLDCAKVAIPQDEYSHSEFLDEWLCELDVSAVISNFDAKHWKALYPLMSSKAAFYEAFTGYVDQEAARFYSKKCPPSHKRPFDIVYRAKRLPYWYGSHGQEKHRIAQVVRERARVHGLTCDISTRPEDTILGPEWLQFLASGRTVIGCEGGSSVLDRRGEMRARIERLLKQNPEISFREVHERMPKGWDEYEFFAISPRHFEAVMTKTCQVLVEGYYNGVLEPNEHYIPLRRDFSNVDEVLEQIQDPELIGKIAERAYTDVVLSGRYSYLRFAQVIESAIEKVRIERKLPRRRGGSVRGQVAWGMGRGRAKLVEIKHRLLREARSRAERWRMYRSVSGNPMIYMKACLVLKLILANRALLRIFVYYLRYGHLRRIIRLEWLLEDLLKLGLLQGVQVGKWMDMTDVRIDVCYKSSGDALVFRSTPVSKAGDDGRDGMGLNGVGNAIEKGNVVLRKIVWDHSAIGNSIIYPLSRTRRLTISLEPDGVYEFTALSAFARQFPKQAWQALIPLHAERPANCGHPG